MTDTRHTGSARADAIYAAMAWTGHPKDTVAAVIDHIPTDTLQRLHDERRMTTCPVCAGVGNVTRIRARKLHKDKCPKCNGAGTRPAPRSIP